MPDVGAPNRPSEQRRRSRPLERTGLGRIGRIARRVGVTVAGALVIAVGIVLLPLPGPGWLIIFAGLGILGTEYAWARRLLARVRRQVRRWTKWIASKPMWMRVLAGLLSVLVIVGLVLVTLFLPI
jgi:uncharacterized protein (TIGR02611 family)